CHYLAATVLLAVSTDGSGVPTTASPKCGCVLCGPGGTPCNGCANRSQLCQDLVWQVRELKKKIQQCVCGIPTWMM
ncbi:hypothetical protein KR074_005766, partial [Drosophila pseudoananassae]